MSQKEANRRQASQPPQAPTASTCTYVKQKHCTRGCKQEPQVRHRTWHSKHHTLRYHHRQGLVKHSGKGGQQSRKAPQTIPERHQGKRGKQPPQVVNVSLGKRLANTAHSTGHATSRKWLLRRPIQSCNAECTERAASERWKSRGILGPVMLLMSVVC